MRRKCIPKIKEVRKSKGIMQKWMAEQIGVAPEHLRMWEKGSSYPTAPNLLRMCIVLDCDIRDLYEEIEE